jgi:hypothetical protein
MVINTGVNTIVVIGVPANRLLKVKNWVKLNIYINITETTAS